MRTKGYTLYGIQDSGLPQGVLLEDMKRIVRNYIRFNKGVLVNIVGPDTDKDLQLLGLAYDVAMADVQFLSGGYHML